MLHPALWREGKRENVVRESLSSGKSTQGEDFPTTDREGVRASQNCGCEAGEQLLSIPWMMAQLPCTCSSQQREEASPAQRQLRALIAAQALPF